ncbi:MAG TPA: hypothetical protein VH740_00855 [Vicinamibacterales bacterium]|jgi:hypothetical protein
MTMVAIGSAAATLIQSIGKGLGSAAPEPVWMMVWGVGLLALASGVRSFLVRRHALEAE